MVYPTVEPSQLVEALFKDIRLITPFHNSKTIRRNTSIKLRFFSINSFDFLDPSESKILVVSFQERNPHSTILPRNMKDNLIKGWKKCF